MAKKTVVVKIGTSSLTEKSGRLDVARLHALTSQIADLRDSGAQVILVTSAAIAAGYSLLGYQERPVSVPAKQASAAVGQGLLMEEYTRALAERGYVAAQILLTRADFCRQAAGITTPFPRFEVLLSRGAVPVINENDTVSIAELKLGDNDMLSVPGGRDDARGFVGAAHRHRRALYRRPAQRPEGRAHTVCGKGDAGDRGPGRRGRKRPTARAVWPPKSRARNLQPAPVCPL